MSFPLSPHARFDNNVIFFLHFVQINFVRYGLTNVHNTEVWADENPNAIVKSHHKKNLWAGIVDNFVLGLQPCIYSNEWIYLMICLSSIYVVLTRTC